PPLGSSRLRHPSYPSWISIFIRCTGFVLKGKARRIPNLNAPKAPPPCHVRQGIGRDASALHRVCSITRKTRLMRSEGCQRRAPRGSLMLPCSARRDTEDFPVPLGC